MRKDIEEFFSFAECFPSAIAGSMGNNWKPDDILRIIKELRLLTLIGDPLTTVTEERPKVSYGALYPKQIP